VWRDHLEPQLRGDVSSAVFAVIENAVNNVFASRQVLWATVGGGLALWLFAAGFGRVALGRETPESRILIWAHRLRRADRPRVSG
jgi:choline-glycine betaine transporter